MFALGAQTIGNPVEDGEDVDEKETRVHRPYWEHWEKVDFGDADQVVELVCHQHDWNGSKVIYTADEFNHDHEDVGSRATSVFEESKSILDDLWEGYRVQRKINILFILLGLGIGSGMVLFLNLYVNETDVGRLIMFFFILWIVGFMGVWFLFLTFRNVLISFGILKGNVGNGCYLWSMFYPCELLEAQVLRAKNLSFEEENPNYFFKVSYGKRKRVLVRLYYSKSN